MWLWVLVCNRMSDKVPDWIGSRRIVDKYPEFTKEVDLSLREFRGPGIYKDTGQRIAPLQKTYECREPLRLYWIRTQEEYDDRLWVDGTS